MLTNPQFHVKYVTESSVVKRVSIIIITNNKCKDYSYKCETCHRFYKTKDLPIDEHECDKIKCGNCKKNYVDTARRAAILDGASLIYSHVLYTTPLT